MFKTIPIIVMAMFCLNFNSRAQSQQTLPLPQKQAILGLTNEIIIEGKIDSSIINRFNTKELLIKIHDPVKALNNEELLISISLAANGAFTCKIPSALEQIYLSFWTYNENKNNGIILGEIIPINFPSKHNTSITEVYLFEVGDAVQIELTDKGDLNFSGQGADKLNYQSQMYGYGLSPEVMGEKHVELVNNHKHDEWLLFQYKVLKEEREARLNLLKAIKPKVSSKIYSILYNNTISFADYYFLIDLNLAGYNSDAIAAIRKFFEQYLSDNNLNEKNLKFITGSYYYQQYLFQKEWNAIKLFSGNLQKGDSFASLYEIIKEKYNGELRDQLLLICFRELNKYFSTETRLFVDETISIVKDTHYKKALLTFKEKQYAAFPFELQDVSGKIHKLGDYKGKVIVIDFWFTGCTWCKTLNRAMRPIIEKYKENKNVVFLSISEDKEKSTWKNSIATGAYTSPHDINLYTNGLGVQHSILKYYNFTGAPKQIIIGRNGLIITTSPPRPDTDNRTELSKSNPDPTVILSGASAKAFMKIIDDNLKVL